MNKLAKKLRAFTLIELLTVMAIIVALAGLTLMGAGWANKKAATSRAEAEIQSLSLALENYKTEQGTYPIPKAQVTGTSQYYNPNNVTLQGASRALYQGLSGDGDDYLYTSGTGGSSVSDGKLDTDRTRYYEFKTKMLAGVNSSTGIISGTVYVQDPFGYSYGYYTPNISGSTAGSGTAQGYNPTFDLWSTAGSTTSPATPQTWVKNW